MVLLQGLLLDIETEKMTVWIDDEVKGEQECSGIRKRARSEGLCWVVCLDESSVIIKGGLPLPG